MMQKVSIILVVLGAITFDRSCRFGPNPHRDDFSLVMKSSLNPLRTDY
jgi:hypothetical protein